MHRKTCTRRSRRCRSPCWPLSTVSCQSCHLPPLWCLTSGATVRPPCPTKIHPVQFFSTKVPPSLLPEIRSPILTLTAALPQLMLPARW